MKKIPIALAVIALFITPTIEAQLFKGAIFAGISGNQVDGDNQSGYKKPGLYGGVSVETDFGKYTGAKIELFYIGKGAIKNVDGVEEFNTSLHYIEMPFLFSIKPIKKFQLDLGLAGSYLIKSKLVELYLTVPESAYSMHNFEFSWIVSAIYYFFERFGVNAKINYSIVPIKNNPNWYANTICFGILYKFK